ncbi:SGNH/GDSL hydrolase family protein [Streptomyces sp. H27-C3]|uniref:SGNH/GDSL hydrolase family protein n=1 Tax=Streptomyces sp. H27-C3 TaxID=3046305 RepID=UPI0024B9A83D|nr:SGNH/GDSL hydrolase family protein [Streptomyces sp. H27-C3]MDJ0461108.1 SGNH/GDSL hydrolase family protein [Streptomyces sp. H27-C3]
MTKRTGYALLAALAAVVVLVSGAIFAGATLSDAGKDTQADPHPRTPLRSAAPANSGTWTGTWATAPAGAEPGTENGFPGRSIRNVVHTSIGGSSARITLSNLYGTRPLRITHASIAVAATPGAPTAANGTMRRLLFGGSPTVIIPAGGQALSDAAPLRVPADGDLLVTTYSPTPSGPATHHPRARQTSYIAEGDRTQDVLGDLYAGQTPYWRYLTAVDVLSGKAQGAVVVIGDSITDGVTSTAGANRRWTDVLADRLDGRYSVLNQGISGNRLLMDGTGPSALSRFDRDVLSRSGAKAVVIVLGINDILRPPHEADPARITAGLEQLARQARARGLRVVGSTLMPFEGTRVHTPQLEAVRDAVNDRIRAGGIFDAVVDFDRALRDPYAPDRLLPAYDSGDHLHPSDAGYRRMGMAFDPATLSRSTAPAEL